MDWKKILKTYLSPRPVKPDEEKLHELKVELGQAGYVSLQVKVDFTKVGKDERDFVSGLIGTMQEFNDKKV